MAQETEQAEAEAESAAEVIGTSNSREKTHRLIWSTYGGPRSFQTIVGGSKDDDDGDVRDIVLQPGPNRIREELFQKIKDNGTFKKGVQAGYFEVGKGPEQATMRDWTQLDDRPDKGLHSHLSKRATEVDSEPIMFDGDGASSPDGEKRKHEDRLKSLRNKYGINDVGLQ